MVNFSSEKQILEFLENNYFIKENKYFSRHEGIHVWGNKVTEEISLIFSYNTEFCKPIFKLWVTSKGLNNEEYDAAWENSLFNVELIQDLQAYHNNIAELTAMLSEQVAAEIDREIIRNIFNFSGGTIHLRGE
jgi:hypothetical protein